jgi:chorismate-pyruvate lyase
MPDLAALLRQFPSHDDIRSLEFVPETELPSPYRQLLAHHLHMTVTVEAHYGSPVDVRVLEDRLDGDIYARKILLTLQNSGKIVQYGLVRIRLDFVSPEVREEITSRKTPLGRILIEHNVLRTIIPVAYLRVMPGPAMMQWFGCDAATPAYGRAAVITCDDQPAIEVVEIVAPEPTQEHPTS